jgi:FkbM family methyltransferase
MGKVSRLIHLLKKSIGEARWSQYQTFEEKLEIFKIIFRLRYLSEIDTDHKLPPSQKIFGYTVKGTTYKELLYLFREIFMEEQYKFSPENKAPRILDCGANIGMALIYFKVKFPDAHILAFEPNPVVFELLKENVSANNLKNVEIVNAGLANEIGVIDFYIDRKNTLVSSVDPTRAGKEKIQVKAVTLSTYLQGKQFDFAKIDIEGAEWQLIKDIDPTGTINNIKQYIFEYHHNYEERHSMSEFLKAFEKHGFEYNLNASFREQGQFQDIALNFYKRSKAS